MNYKSQKASKHWSDYPTLMFPFLWSLKGGQNECGPPKGHSCNSAEKLTTTSSRILSVQKGSSKSFTKWAFISKCFSLHLRHTAVVLCLLGKLWAVYYLFLQWNRDSDCRLPSVFFIFGSRFLFSIYTDIHCRSGIIWKHLCLREKLLVRFLLFFYCTNVPLFW